MRGSSVVDRRIVELALMDLSRRCTVQCCARWSTSYHSQTQHLKFNVAGAVNPLSSDPRSRKDSFFPVSHGHLIHSAHVSSTRHLVFPGQTASRPHTYLMTGYFRSDLVFGGPFFKVEQIKMVLAILFTCLGNSFLSVERW